MSPLWAGCGMEIEHDGKLWTAYGEGAKRPIVVEAESKPEAIKAYGEIYSDQLNEANIPIVEVLEESWNFHITTNLKQ